MNMYNFFKKYDFSHIFASNSSYTNHLFVRLMNIFLNTLNSGSPRVTRKLPIYDLGVDHDIFMILEFLDEELSKEEIRLINSYIDRPKSEYDADEKTLFDLLGIFSYLLYFSQNGFIDKFCFSILLKLFNNKKLFV